jgi:hypothetical protein
MKIWVVWVTALMMEAVQTCETLVNSYQSTWRYNPADVLQIWSEATNKLNKQPQTADKEWFPNLGGRRWVQNSLP